jgi:hypothetical protein
METTVTIKPTPKEIADMLFELDDREVMKVFDEWNKNFEEEYKKPSRSFKVDFYGFCLYFTRDMSESAKEMVRGMYSALIYNTCTKPYYDKTRY